MSFKVVEKDKGQFPNSPPKKKKKAVKNILSNL